MTQMTEAKLREQELILRVPIPMAPPLRSVNSYILRGDEGITIIDPGPRTPESEEQWQQVWGQHHLSPCEVTRIVVTHHHPDHYGLAGWLQETTGATVLMSRRAFAEAELMWGMDSQVEAALPEWFGQHGMPESWCEQLPGHLYGFRSQVTPPPEVTFIQEGESITMGGRVWHAVETAGHAPGHLSFYDALDKRLICGDAVLPQISPNIGFLPGSDPQPLYSFLGSLVKLRAYEVKWAYPGHRHKFDYFARRISQLFQHHEERLSRIEVLLRERPYSGFEVCASLFGTDLGIHQMRFAMSETLAHLVELVRQGRARELTTGSSRNTTILYELK